MRINSIIFLNGKVYDVRGGDSSTSTYKKKVRTKLRRNPPFAPFLSATNNNACGTQALLFYSKIILKKIATSPA